MEYQERLVEADRLRDENQAVLSTPLMSEGNISPMQVGMFSPRQKARWQANAMEKMAIEHTIKRLLRSDEEIAYDEKRIADNQEKERQSTLAILQSKIDFIYSLKRMAYKKNGELKVSYQRTVEGYQGEISKLNS